MRYELTSFRPTGPGDITSLESAFDRLCADGDPRGLGHVEVSTADDGCICVSMDMGSYPRATSRAEKAYALAWYDAFGVRGNVHDGHVVGARSEAIRG